MRSSGVGAASAGASARARHRALAAEHRNERLVIGAALGCGAGIVAAGLSLWWTGPIAGVLAFGGHMLYLRQRPGPVTSWRQGAVAERRTGRRLARLDPAGFHVLHDRALPVTPIANLDHLVVGLTGVYAIASRRCRWGARLRVLEGRLWVGGRSGAGLAGTSARAARMVAELLSGEVDHDVPVTAVVAVHGASVPHGGLRYRSVLLQAARAVPKGISTRPVVFTSAQVATMAAVAERLLPPMVEVISPSSATRWRPTRCAGEGGGVVE